MLRINKPISFRCLHVRCWVHMPPGSSHFQHSKMHKRGGMQPLQPGGVLAQSSGEAASVLCEGNAPGCYERDKWLVNNTIIWEATCLYTGSWCSLAHFLFISMVALCHCSLSSSDKASQHSFNIIWNRPVCCFLSIFDVFHQFVASLLVKSLILSRKRSRETTGFLFNHEEQCLILGGVWCLAFLVVIFLVEFLANMMSIRHHCKHGIRFAAHLFPFWDGNCAHLQLSLELYKKFLPTLSQPVSQVTVVLWFRLSWLVCLVFFFSTFCR